VLRTDFFLPPATTARTLDRFANGTFGIRLLIGYDSVGSCFVKAVRDNTQRAVSRCHRLLHLRSYTTRERGLNAFPHG
jgi:hypothetical protein